MASSNFSSENSEMSHACFIIGNFNCGIADNPSFVSFLVCLDVLQTFSSSFIFTTFCDSQNTQVAWNSMAKNNVKLEKKTG